QPRFSLPCLPKVWKPAAWLAIKLSILAGRLYFKFAEYAALANCLGLAETSLGNMGNIYTDSAMVGADGVGDGVVGNRQPNQIQESMQANVMYYRQSGQTWYL